MDLACKAHNSISKSLVLVGETPTRALYFEVVGTCRRNAYSSLLVEKKKKKSLGTPRSTPDILRKTKAFRFFKTK